MLTSVNYTNTPKFQGKPNITKRQEIILDLHSKGHTLSEIAKKCNVEISYVYRILKCSNKISTNNPTLSNMAYTNNIKDNVLKDVLNKLKIPEDKLKGSVLF